MKEIKNSFMLILTAKQRLQFIGISILIAVQSIFETLAVFLIFPFVYTLMGSESIDSYQWMKYLWDLGDCKTSNDLLIFLAIILICVYVLKNVVAIAVKWIQCKWMAKLHSDLMTDIYSSFLNKKYSFFLKADTGDITRAVTDDITRFYELLKCAFDLFQNGLLTVFLLVTLISINPSMVAVGGTIIIISIFLLNKIVSKRINKYGEMGTTTLTEAISWVNQSMGLIKNILINRKQKYYINKFKNYSKELFGSRTSYEVIACLPGKIVESLCMSIVFVFIILFIRQGNNITTMVSQFAVFALAVVKIMPSVVNINGDLNKIKYHTTAVDNIIKNMGDSRLISEEITNENLTSFKNDILLSDVSFKYEDADAFLYSHVDFDIKAGSSVAFIGKTGSGKTTLADIILGLHNPSCGKISVDGKDIAENKNSWGKMIGYIPQNIYLGNCSIAQNVAFGEASIDTDRVKKCLDEAKLLEHVNSLPNGIETIIGENGVKLSGGQRQRLGIARALYNNPRFLVMDEATSALDPDTEAAITESIKSLSHKITILIIAHRINTILDCDFIYRVEDGKIVEVVDRSKLTEG